ncbi:hypothetical protein D0B54_13735 [Solimonas sp. K1W22B-7]|uniref:FecR family protein n=1 Tax=Solimonas sp. K1W22B-7 TaxID=2303331 RepID=UPI000E330982|nr:FecR domain-containing protein [Solimonas sp. K1W22B-7]AXQ29675.1 hypothetical protein D0B54_13735 [Solimonas sp. K1W22B-7]
MSTQTILMRTGRLAAALALCLAGGAAQAAAAKVMLVTGVATATAPGGAARGLHRGDPVEAGEALEVGNNSYLSLSFADGGRVLLRPNTRFEVEAYDYPAAAAPVAAAPAAAAEAAPVTAAEPAPRPGSGKAFFKLVRGGFRAISGLVGKQDKQDYLVRTTVATIGIRGTDYVAELCSGEQCAGPYLQVEGDLSEALQVGVNEGAIEVTTPDGTPHPVEQGQFGLATRDGRFFALPLTPMSYLLNPMPDPEGCQ